MTSPEVVTSQSAGDGARAQWLNGALVLGMLAAVLALLVIAVIGQWRSLFQPAAPTTIVSASLESLKAQNVLVPFTARFVADPTSRVTRLGLSAQKTLIVPGTVRYELDLGALDQRAVRWNAKDRRLTITLPPLRLSDPDMDPARAVEYRDGRLVLAVTDAEKQLDAANWAAAKDEILAQAGGAVPLGLAQQAAINAVAANFQLPLKTAGIDAAVTVVFAQ